MRFVSLFCAVLPLALVVCAHYDLIPVWRDIPPHPELEALEEGNKRYRQKMERQYPGLLQALAKNGQHPPFVMFDCSDSRVSEPLIFSSLPGDIFTAANIANQFHEDDVTSAAVLGYAVEHLHVKHIIVMGHYGCGGIQAAMLPPPSTLNAADEAIQAWVQPIRELYQTSPRQEIVDHRRSGREDVDLHTPAFRALVEENVKVNVQRIASSQIMKEHYASKVDQRVFIHGFVYDIETGKVTDLRMSLGPTWRDYSRSSSPFFR